MLYKATEFDAATLIATGRKRFFEAPSAKRAADRLAEFERADGRAAVVGENGKSVFSGSVAYAVTLPEKFPRDVI